MEEVIRERPGIGMTSRRRNVPADFTNKNCAGSGLAVSE